MMVIQVYAPTTDAEDRVDKFYYQVKSETDRTGKQTSTW